MNTLGNSFVLLNSQKHDHLTPGGAVQKFQFSLFRHEPIK